MNAAAMPREGAQKPRTTRPSAPKSTDANASAESLLDDLSAIVEAATPPAEFPAYGTLAREVETVLSDTAPTLKAAMQKPRVEGQPATRTEAAPEAEQPSPDASSRRHRTLASMAGATSRAETRLTPTLAPASKPEDAQAEALGTSQPRGRHTSATLPVPTVRPPVRNRPASQADHGFSSRATPALSRPLPLPEADLVVPAAAAHSALTVAAAGVTAALAMEGQSQLATMMLILTGLLGLGAGTAYTLAHALLNRQAGAIVLIAADLSALAWSFAFFGYRSALLLLIPALVILALRMAGQLAGLLMTAGAVLISSASAWLAVEGPLQSPLPLDGDSSLFVDTAIALVGILLTTWAVLGLYESQSRSLALARARRHEATVLREQITSLRHATDDDAERIQAALAVALTGEAVAAAPLRSPLSPLGEAAGALAGRIRTLQRDREERLRLEGALRRMVLAVQRSHLGLPWSWPRRSGTVADDLMAVLPGPPAPRASDTLGKELESLAQVSTFDGDEAAARERVPSWPRPVARAPQTPAQSRKRPTYLRPVDPSALDTPSVPDPESPLAEENYSIGEP
jgi:hypothetical protein